jgi:hypothetical protein
MANTYALIQSQTLGADAASVAFNSIPQTYTDLVFHITARGTTNNLSTRLRFNGNSVGYGIAEYYAQANTNTNGNQYFNNTEIDTTRTNQANSSFTASTFSSIEVYICNYSSSSINKSLSNFSASQQMSVSIGNLEVMSAIWANNEAITSVSFFPNVVNFAAGSTFNLYGIKNS